MWSKNPPTNRNIDPHFWNEAQRRHELYLDLHAKLVGIGLSAASADAYLEAFEKLQRAVEMLNPTEPDFFVDDHSNDFGLAIGSLESMKSHLGYGE